MFAIVDSWSPPRFLPALPRRDEHARAQLRAAATRAAPAVLAGDRLLAVAGPIGHLLPAGGIRRGSTVALDGPPGAGSTTVALLLAAATTSVGEWVAVVDPAGTLGARAAAEVGVALERCAIVRHVAPDRWPTVVGALLDGVSLVAAAVPPGLAARRRPPAHGPSARARHRARRARTVAGRGIPASPRAGPRLVGARRPAEVCSRRSDVDVRVEGKGVRAHARAG